MQRPNYLAEIKNRIISGTKGAIYVPADFIDIAQRTAVKMALSRLEEEKLIRRIMRGVYEYPEYSSFLQEFVAPDTNKVAQALARNFGWTIAPCGNTALNLLGLSLQVPAVWSYVSDGPYRTYQFDTVTLRFKHSANKDSTGISPKSALVIQALKTLGNKRVDEAIQSLRITLTPEEKKKMLFETQYTTSWIYEAIKKICKPGDENAQDGTSE